jgi:hypothetical protein
LKGKKHTKKYNKKQNFLATSSFSPIPVTFQMDSPSFLVKYRSRQGCHTARVVPFSTTNYSWN